MAEKKWNEEQLKAISATNGNILVSAAAGSGKTAVLVERVIRLMTQENAIPADRFLIVTFTKMAATEMKERILSALSSLALQKPHDENLQKQQINMEKSHISTIHSFCSQIITDNFNLLEIAPDCQIADENESKDLSAEALEQVLELYYSNEDHTFLELSETLGGGKDDFELGKAILTLYNFIRSLPHYEKWLDDMSSFYDPSIPVSESIWGKIINEYSDIVLSKAYSDANNLLEECPKYSADEFISMLNDDIAYIELLRDRLKNDTWDEFRKVLQNSNYTRRPKAKTCDPIFFETIKNVRDNYKKIISDLSKKYMTGEKEFRDDINDLQPKISMLFSVVMDYDRIYSEIKKEKHLLDYSDLEQMTLKLLCDTDSNGNYVKSNIAKEIESRYDYILVDECQDINKVQDTIISMISNGKNIFFVGDVKQSIYRFRQAMPELFIQKKNSWKIFNGNNYPATITLGRNYRSRKNITDAVNFIFQQIMNKKAAEIEYTKDEMLLPEADYFTDDNIRNKFVLIKGEKDNDTKAEAQWVAKDIINNIVNKVNIKTDSGIRPAQFSDICILMRSTKNCSDIFASELRSKGIECRIDKGNVFLSRPEISAILNVLKAVDNPLLDIPLCGAMMSEMFLFTADELTEIRLGFPKSHLYSAVKECARSGNKKCSSFIDFLDSIRKFATSESSDSVIEKIYSQTSFFQMMRYSDGGDTKAANLKLLVKYAQDREKSGYHGVSAFLRFIDHVESSGNDFSPAASSNSGENSVKIMTVHSSKGLEFPIVYLCGTKHKFNLVRSDQISLHPSLGIACSRRDSDTGLRFKTVPQEALNLKLRSSDIAEEIRILYVALTRAKENLIITCTCSDPEGFLKKSATSVAPYSNKMDPFTVSNAQSEADWLIPSILRHPDSGNFRNICGLNDSVILPDNSHWNAFIFDGHDENDFITKEAVILNAEPSPDLIRILNERKDWVYPHKAAETIPSKLSVSELSHAEVKKEFQFSAVPTKDNMSATQKGIAIHKFLQFCIFKNLENEDVEKEIKRLVDNKFISEKEASAINLDQIYQFIHSALFKKIKNSVWSKKEYRFVQSISAQDLNIAESGRDDIVTVQGVLDYIFQYEDEYYIVDYKTDIVDSPEELVYRYKSQLELYKLLISKYLMINVSHTRIWSFHLGQEIVLS